MASITITSYNSATGCIYFTVVDITPSTSVYVQKSTNGGTTWNTVNFEGGTNSPYCGYIVTVPTLFRLYAQAYNIYSNEFSSVPVEPASFTVTRTPIENETDISFCNSPIHIEIANDLNDASIISAKLYLWIWNGAQNKTLGKPTQTLSALKISKNDNYINFEISEYIKSYLISPINSPNSNQPNFAYNELMAPAISGQGVFWQIIADVTSTGGVLRKNFRTSFATLGYFYDYEQSAKFPFTTQAVERPKYANPKIHDYFKQVFNLTQTLSAATTDNIINFNPIIPSTYLREAMDPTLIVYLNKCGLWECFTPNGKVTTTNKKKFTTSNLNYRKPSKIDNAFVHSKITDNFDVDQSITINTGILEGEMVEQIQQIVLSPKIYLIKFDGTLNLTGTNGITIDNTFITIDNNIVTIDSQTVGSEFLGFYKNHRQIPVVLTDSDFEYKTRLNDKNRIEYNLKFDLTTNLINDLK